MNNKLFILGCALTVLGFFLFHTCANYRFIDSWEATQENAYFRFSILFCALLSALFGLILIYIAIGTESDTPGESAPEK